MARRGGALDGPAPGRQKPFGNRPRIPFRLVNMARTATGPFQLARIPPVHFGPGKLAVLPQVAAAFGRHARFGRHALIVTGSSSLKSSGRVDGILAALDADGIATRTVRHRWRAVHRLHRRHLRLPAGIRHRPGDRHRRRQRHRRGQGPVGHAAHGNSVLDHLEDVGRNVPHSGVKLPFVAVPTTSGTGGEMTKNAVLSDVGPDGYKKSLRHDAFIPDAVILDPELMLSCPPAITAACGMDAFTQLLEPYLSPAASPVTDSLALGAMERVRDNLAAACGEGAGDVEVRAGMAYAAMISGIALANAGLGIVHGLASPIGGFFPVPHGVVCGTLVAPATEANIRALRAAAAGDGKRRRRGGGTRPQPLQVRPGGPPLRRPRRPGRCLELRLPGRPAQGADRGPGAAAPRPLRPEGGGPRPHRRPDRQPEQPGEAHPGRGIGALLASRL